MRFAAFSSDGAFVVTASIVRTAKIWNSSNDECLWTLAGHKGIAWSAAFSSDGALVVTASSVCTAKIWDATKGECVLTLASHDEAVSSAALSVCKSPSVHPVFRSMFLFHMARIEIRTYGYWHEIVYNP